MTTTAAEAIAAPARLERYRDELFAGDLTIDKALAYLRELSTADVTSLAPDIADRDRARSVALGHMQGALQSVALLLTSRLTPEVRCAPVTGLAEVIADVLRDCPGVGCRQSIAPWGGSTCGDPTCEAQYRRSVGEA